MEDFFSKIEGFFKGGKSLEEEKMTFTEIVNKNNYPMETFCVTTEDGYLLKLFRIPGSKDSTFKGDNTKNQPILLQHGIFDSSDGWISNSPDKCLPFILADLGYDVFLSNSRGNKHSKSHQKYYLNSFEFWSFSFHEMALYDIPAILGKVSEVNKSGKKIIYIGHSQGTCQMFAALSINNDYIKSKVKLFIAFAPVARVGGVSSNFLKALDAVNVGEILKVTKSYELFPEDKHASKFTTWVNNNFPSVTNGILDLVSDNNSLLNNNKEWMGVFFNHYPSGSSLKAVNHFIQLFRTDRFCQYDYGKEANLHIYKQLEPTDYPLQSINGVSIGLFCGTEDKLATLRDVRWLRDMLGSNVVEYKEYQKMGHLTFLMPLDIEWLDDVISLITKFTE